MRSIDATQLEVIRNALESTSDGMAVTLARSARSTIVRTGWDFSTAVLSAQGELVGQGMGHPIHLGGMVPALRACLHRYQDRIYPGDILANNDPYEGGSHLPDIYLYKPVYVGGVLVGYLCSMAHHSDIGGRVPAGMGHDNTEIYQEGIRIPPLKLYEQGDPNETLFRLIEKAVRGPELVLADLRAQVAALHFGEEELLRVVRQYGVEEFTTSVDGLVDYTERLTRQALRALPDGSWSFTDYLDNDGITDETIAIVATLTKNGDELHVDFTGSSPQCKGSIQGVMATTGAMVYTVVKSVLGGDIPNTTGLFRPVKITAPEGSFVNPRAPAPVAARSVGGRRISHAVWGAFAQMIPERVFACPGGVEGLVLMSGYDKRQMPWKGWILCDGSVAMEIATGGRPTKDGIEGQCSNVTNLANMPVETIEAELPVTIEEYAFLPDSEGAGKFRGGLGMIRQWRYLLNDSVVQVVSDRSKHPPWGLQGGGSAAPPRVVYNPGTKDRMLPGKCTVEAKAGDVLRVGWGGAGGHGDPLERDPEMVLWDVIEEKVSVQRAQDTYGVVVNPEHRTIDWETTHNLRRR